MTAGAAFAQANEEIGTMKISTQELRELLSNLLAVVKQHSQQTAQPADKLDNGMLNKYVLVRCRDAGVHAGVLVSHYNRECVLTEARRLWKWVPTKGGLLSAVAEHGLKDESIVGCPQRRIHLTETCEIAECSPEAEVSIRSKANSHE